MEEIPRENQCRIIVIMSTREEEMLKGYPLAFTGGKELRKAEEAEKKKAELREEWIKDKITELFVIFNILKPSSNDVGNADTFIRSIIRDARFLC